MHTDAQGRHLIVLLIAAVAMATGASNAAAAPGDAERGTLTIGDGRNWSSVVKASPDGEPGTISPTPTWNAK